MKKKVVYMVMHPTYYFTGKCIFVIKNELKKAKLTQTKIASLLGVSEPYINAMINGKKPISYGLKKVLEEQLNIKLQRGKKNEIEEEYSNVFDRMYH